MARHKQPPGESGGRRKVGEDSGSPSTGDGRNRSRGKIPGSDVSFKTSGEHEVGRGGGFLARLIRRSTDGGRHS